MNPQSLAIFASGSGTNAENIIKYFRNSPLINIQLIATNNAEAFVLKRAEKFGVDQLVFSKSQLEDRGFLSSLQGFGIDYIILAGFLLKIPGYLIDHYPNKILNIHPALLPLYGGKGMYGDFVHDAVLKNGDQESGISIHLVNENYDEGQIIFQKKCPVFESDDVSSLAKRIHALEYEFFPKIIEDYILNQQSHVSK